MIKITSTKNPDNWLQLTNYTIEPNEIKLAPFCHMDWVRRLVSGEEFEVEFLTEDEKLVASHLLEDLPFIASITHAQFGCGALINDMSVYISLYQY